MFAQLASIATISQLKRLAYAQKEQPNSKTSVMSATPMWCLIVQHALQLMCVRYVNRLSNSHLDSVNAPLRLPYSNLHVWLVILVIAIFVSQITLVQLVRPNILPITICALNARLLVVNSVLLIHTVESAKIILKSAPKETNVSPVILLTVMSALALIPVPSVLKVMSLIQITNFACSVPRLRVVISARMMEYAENV